MPSRGFSLVEMVTVVASMALLIALGTLMFHRYDRSFRAEAQTRLILTELMKARMQAITMHRATRVKLYPDRFEVYSTAGEDGGGPVLVHQLKIPLSSSAPGFGAGVEVDFKETGLTDDWCSVCVDADTPSQGLDSIVISATRTSSGTKDKGNECIRENITIK